jgi:Protein of unknown function (DUF3159)
VSQPSRPAADDPASTANEAGLEPALREQVRSQILTGLGGWTGMVIAAIPTVVFVTVNGLSSLRTALIAAVGAALLLSLYRLMRRQSTQQAITGLLGVVLAAAIAARTGEARGFFLLGIGASLLYGSVFLLSLVVRRPLVGVIWEYLDPSPETAPPRPWYRRRELLSAYMWATAAVTAVFAARGVVQLTLFAKRDTGLLAVARIAMGYPLTVLALLFALWVVRRARQSVSSTA